MKVNNRGENVILEMVKPLKNKGYEFPRTHIIVKRLWFTVQKGEQKNIYEKNLY